MRRSGSVVTTVLVTVATCCVSCRMRPDSPRASTAEGVALGVIRDQLPRLVCPAQVAVVE